MNFSSGQRTAIKVHHCDWCGERINVGDRYCWSTGIWDGRVSTTKFHPECEAACRKTEDPEDGFDVYMQDRPFVPNYVI